MEAFWIGPQPAPYTPVWHAMQAWTAGRGPDTPDQIWLTQHLPVYTLGQAGRREHLLAPGPIAVVATDRGGQVTYHGPGQVVAYVLFDLRRAGYYIKEYVHRLESAVIDTLTTLGVAGATRYPGAPGVYVPRVAGARPEHDALTHFAKIAALGVKVRQGCTYHGVALNVAMDLTPFRGIDPCGYAGLITTDVASQGPAVALEHAATTLVGQLHWHLTGTAPSASLVAPTPRALTDLCPPEQAAP